MDGHNTALLREQALAAQEASRDLLPPPGRDRERDRRDDRGSTSVRPSRPAGAARLFGGALGAASTSKSRQTEVERDRDGDPRRQDGRGSRRHEDERSRNRRDREPRDRYDTDDRDGSQRRSRSGDVVEKRSTRGSEGRDHDRDKGKRRERSPLSHGSRSPRRKQEVSPPRIRKPAASDRVVQRDRSPEPSTIEGPAPPIQSKMDRYFDEAYNPQLDFTGVLPIPSDGLVPDVGWDNMLAVLKEKGRKVGLLASFSLRLGRILIAILQKRATSPGFSPSPPPAASHRRQRSLSPTRTTSRSDRRRDSGRSGTHKSKDKDRGKNKRRHRSRSPGSGLSAYDSEDSEARERRKRKKRKEKERRKAEEEEEDKKKFGGYVYARQGSTRDWDVGKIDMSF